MKAVVAIAVLTLIIALVFAFAYLHSRSIDRAHVINCAGDLLSAHQHLQQYGSLTNYSHQTHHSRVYVFTNRVTVGGAVFQCELAEDSPALADFGFMVIAKDETLIWIDKESGPAVFRGADRRNIMPRRFQ